MSSYFFLSRLVLRSVILLGTFLYQEVHSHWVQGNVNGLFLARKQVARLEVKANTFLGCSTSAQPHLGAVVSLSKHEGVTHTHSSILFQPIQQLAQIFQ